MKTAYTIDRNRKFVRYFSEQKPKKIRKIRVCVCVCWIGTMVHPSSNGASSIIRHADKLYMGVGVSIACFVIVVNFFLFWLRFKKYFSRHWKSIKR